MKQRRLVILLTALVVLVATDCRNTNNAQVEDQSSAAAQGATAEGGSGTVPDANMPREQIPEQFRWDLSPLVENDTAFDEMLSTAAEQRAELESCRGQLSDPARLESCLDLYFRTRLLTNRCTLYSQMQQVTDVSSSDYQARVDRAQSAMNAFMSISSIFRNEILAYEDEQLTAAYEASEGLAQYRPYIERIRRRREHVLGEEAERVLNLAGDNQWAEIDLNEIPSDFERTFGALMSELPLPQITDEQGETVQLTFSNYGRYRASSDRRVRRDAVEGFFAALRNFDATFAAVLGGQARFSVFLARSRGYDSALDAYLLRDEVDPEIYRNLIRTIEANTEPLHRYMRFRQQRMGLDDLHVYDLYTPLVPAVEHEYSYEEAVELITTALAPLGDDYGEVLRTGLDPENGWLDLYPHENKRSGAFSANVYGVHPYIFMNYFGSLDDAMTLAHEYGHALHSFYSMRDQPYISYAYVPLIAETASTFNETLVIRHLIENASNDDERLFLLGELVEMIRTTIYRQALFASFELALHAAAEEGTPITAEFLDQTYRELLQRYYGEALTIGENDGMEWAYVPHFYYKYYVYTYAGGLSSGIALADRVLNGGEEERDAYLGMLSAGGSRPPLDILRSAGADPSDSETLAAAARLMDESLSQMEAITARQ